MPIDFPSSPSVGQQYSFGGVTYTYSVRGIWNLTGGGGFTAANTAPTSPTPGDFWYDLTSGVFAIYVDDGTSSQWVQVAPGAYGGAVPQAGGHIYGLTLSNNVTDANNDIDIAVGSATESTTNQYLMRLDTPITKRLDAAWAVGTNQGGLDTGTKAASIWYHIFLIKRSDTGVVDALFSTSVSSPVMPTNYDQKRRIGSIYSTDVTNIYPFWQDGDTFLWMTPHNTWGINGPGQNVPYPAPVLTPVGIRTIAILTVGTACGGSGGGRAYVGSLDVNNSPGAPGCNFGVLTGGTPGFQSYASARVKTSTDSRVRMTFIDASDGYAYIWLYTVGWVDDRGRFG